MEKKNRLTELPVVFMLAMLCCFLWGSATPAIKIGYQIFGIENSDTISIILFAGIRFFLAGILVIIVQSIMAGHFIKPEKGSFPSIFKLSLAQTMIQYFCFYVGLAHTSGVAGTIISGATGFFSIIIVSLIFRYEKLTLPKIIGCIMGFAGLIIMNVVFGETTVFHFSFLGEGLVLCSTISLAVSSAVAYSIWGILMKYNPVSRVSIFNFLTPLFGVLLSAIFLGEVKQALSWNKLAALILVSGGIYIVNRKYEKA